MRRVILRLLPALLFLGCASGVEIHHPLGGLPDEPSTVRAVVDSLNANLGTLHVAVKSVNGEKRYVSDTVWIDSNTAFTNSAGGRSVRSWEELVGAEIEIKGWYRDDDRYFADEIDVVAFRPQLQ